MTMSTHMQAVHDRAARYDSTLMANDPRFRGIVIIKEQWGVTSFTFQDAFVVEDACATERWYIVFSEHNGFHVYDADDYHAFAFDARKKIDPAPF